MKKFNLGKRIIPESEVVFYDDDFFIMFDNLPVSPSHILIFTMGDETDYFKLSDRKKKKLSDLIERCKDIVEDEYEPDGYNIGMNCGEAAGQSVMKFHCHLIPRYQGDVENPKGGVRHSVIGKGYY